MVNQRRDHPTRDGKITNLHLFDAKLREPWLENPKRSRELHFFPVVEHATERTELQRKSLIRGLAPERLHPAGKQVIAGMQAKGWIEKQADGRTYCITPAGDEALRAIIPGKR